MQVNKINTNMNFKATFSAEVNDKIESLGNYLIEHGEAAKYDNFMRNVQTLKTAFPDRMLEIIPYMDNKQICIWQYNKPGQISTAAENKFVKNAHKTDYFMIQPILQKKLALIHPKKKTFFVSSVLPFNCNFISTDTITEAAEITAYLENREKEKEAHMPFIAPEVVSAKKAKLKKLLYG